MSQNVGQSRMEMIKVYLKKSPEDSFLKHALALEYIKTGDDKQAIDLFREVLAHDPGYVGSYYQLGKILEKTGEMEEAMKIYEIGLQVAAEAGEDHARRELQTAYDELI